MKRSISIVVMILAIIFLQACGSKSKENTDTGAIELTEAQKATEQAAAEAAKARHEKLEKQREDKIEARRVAFMEMIRTTPTYKDAEGRIVYNKAEIDPVYIGGTEAMEKYINENIVYPQEARDKGLEGTVFVDFVVSSDGIIREVKATDASTDDIDQSLRDEAVHIVSSMPAWTPGKQHGKPVHAGFSIPITFVLN